MKAKNFFYKHKTWLAIGILTITQLPFGWCLDAKSKAESLSKSTFLAKPQQNKSNKTPNLQNASIKMSSIKEFKNTQEFTLPNGLKVLIREDHSAPVFTQVVMYKVGSKNDPQGGSGIAHYLEHMQFNGTKSRPKGAISEGIEKRGGSFNAATGTDYTMYYVTIPALTENLDFTLDLEADRMRNSIINQAEAVREKKVVLSELMGGENNPRTLLSREVYKNIFPQHPYGIPIIGWREEVESVKAEALVEFYNTYYQPNNATLILVGDIDSKAAAKKITKYFEQIPASQKPVPERVVFEHNKDIKKNIVVKSPTATHMLSLNWPAVEFRHPDYAALFVLSAILSNGDLSRLEKSLVDTGKVSYIEASMRKGFDPFNFSVFAAADKQADLDSVQKIILKEIENIQSKSVTSEELERVKAKAETGYWFGLEEPDSLASQLGFFEVVAGDWKKAFSWSEQIQAVTVEQVQDVAKKYLKPEQLLVGKLLDDPNYKGPKPLGNLQQSEVANLKPPVISQNQTASLSKTGIHPEKITLPNGITLILRQNKNLPIVAVSASMDAGALFDQKLGKQGISSLTSMMLNRGSKNYTRDQFNIALDRIGADLEVTSQQDYVSFSAKSRARDLDQILGLLAEQARFPNFPKDEFDKLKLQVLSELEQSKDNIGALGKIAIMQAMYEKDHPYYEPTIDEQIKAVQNLSLSDLQDFHKTYFQPERMILVISGDFDKNKLLDSVNKYFADWKSDLEAKPLSSAVQNGELTKASSKTLELAGKSQSVVIMGHVGQINRSHPDFYPLLVANDILGGGSTLASRLGKRVREEAGLVYSIQSSFSVGRSAGPFMLQMGVPAGKVAEAVNLTKDEVKRFISDEIADEEFERAKNFRSGFFVSHNLTSNESVASSLNQYALWNMDLETINTYSQKIQSVTKDDVKRVMAKYLHPDNLHLVIVNPK
jgi:zinc protease